MITGSGLETTGAVTSTIGLTRVARRCSIASNGNGSRLARTPISASRYAGSPLAPAKPKGSSPSGSRRVVRHDDGAGGGEHAADTMADRDLGAGGGVALGNEGAGLAVGHEAEILEAIDRQMREACPWQRTGGVVDHQMVDVLVRDPGLGKSLGAGDAEGARGREIRHLADHRRLDTLAGAEQV